jgi:hypothetical protein
MHVNCAPLLKAMPLLGSGDTLPGQERPGQLAIFASEPGETSSRRSGGRSWPGRRARRRSRSRIPQIDQLEKKGVLSERATSVRLNCPSSR